MKRPRTLSLEAQHKLSDAHTNKNLKPDLTSRPLAGERKRRLTYPFRTEKLQIANRKTLLRLGLITPLKSIENTNLTNSMAVSKELNSTKTVRFTPETKTWDGTRSFNRDFDELIYNFLERRRAIGDADILKWTCANPKRIAALCVLMADLLKRLEKASTNGESVLCLPKGGGKAMKVLFEFRPYLLSLQSVLLEAHKNAKRLREKEKSLQAEKQKRFQVTAVC
mmetsp:Transcript_6634/g.8676  ORF Transcript_6634/g.8676 Transcript_6634/m.8676 type:complete len:224 (-) Transcript_6634:1456-2127(-)